MDTFLNDLEEPARWNTLLAPGARTLLADPSLAEDSRVIVLHGNSPLLLDRYFYMLMDIEPDHVRPCTREFAGEELTYHFSEKHIELPLTAAHVQFIRSVVCNATIGNRTSVFYIRWGTETKAAAAMALKTVMERAPHAVFYLACSHLKHVPPMIRSLGMLVNAGFPLDRLQAYVGPNKDIRDPYLMYANDPVSCVLRSSLGGVTGVDKAILAFLHDESNVATEAQRVMNARELSYKLYHIGYPVANVAKSILMSGELSPHMMTEFVRLAAIADMDAIASKKNVLIYERFLLEVYQLLQTTAPKKKIVRKKVPPA